MRVLKLSTVIFLFFFLTIQSNAQFQESYNLQKEVINHYLKERGEVYFKLFVFSKGSLDYLTNVISIDNIKPLPLGYEIYAYANEKELNDLSKYNLAFEILKHPADVGELYKIGNTPEELLGWDTYPTYTAYVDMMNQFQSQYPSLCKIINIGTTVQGRALLFAKITDSVNYRKNKPQVMLTSTMHGDETTGYVLMLRLIDTLLKAYGVDSNLTYLVKNCEIWINPLANPDGTYYGGNGTVNGARRYNANGYDLNRNFPDPAAGPYPGGTRQPETSAFMNIALANNFVLSTNFHGGAQVVNYPWDTWARLHPDDQWFIFIARQYVDTVHTINPNYMTDLYGYPNIPGITNGYAWYRVTGGRQDYMTYFRGCRETTIELSTTKLLPPAQLPTYWNYNFKSFVNYIRKSLFGLRGIIRDSLTAQPIKARVTVTGFEVADSTQVYSDSLVGNYHRMLKAGNYSVNFSAPNYYPKTISNVHIQNDSTTILNVYLSPINTPIRIHTSGITEFALNQNFPNPFNANTIIEFSVPQDTYVQLSIYDITGRETMALVNSTLRAGSYRVNCDANKLTSGIYFYRFKAGSFSQTKKMLVLK
ncbi:MAG: M14 family zinc carboxypeptidase [Ignavibacteria bacterium]